jgi:hypothetical protein
MNNTYKIKVKSPLLRAGITITTECSEKYVVDVTNKLLSIVREINDNNKPALASTLNPKSKE